MNETESRTKGQKENLGMWGKVSFLCALIAWLFPIACVLLTVVFVQAFEALNKDIPDTELFSIFYHCVSTVPIVLCLIALFVGVGCIVKIKLKNRNARANDKITWSVYLSLLGLVVLLFIIIPNLMTFDLGFRLSESWEDLGQLGRAMSLYTEENNGKLPLPNRWCDILLQNGYATERDLIFKSRGQKDRYYAMNPNFEPNSPYPTVVLFEGKGGWNQFGGPEILTTENHKGEGCNILFNDLHVVFVKTEKLGELNWGIEKE